MAAAGLAVNTVYGAQEYWPEKKLRICVTGAGGFIASHLAKRLKQEGHYVVGCDWKRNEHMPVRGRFIGACGRCAPARAASAVLCASARAHVAQLRRSVGRLSPHGAHGLLRARRGAERARGASLRADRLALLRRLGRLGAQLSCGLAAPDAPSRRARRCNGRSATVRGKAAGGRRAAPAASARAC
jgi:hypothetical protein